LKKNANLDRKKMDRLLPLKLAKTKIKPKKGYHRNVSCTCNQNHIHKSRFEAKVCNELHYEYPKCKIKTEVRFTFYVNDVKICTHYMDFVIDEKKLAVEAKGMPTSTWRIKSKLFKALYPEYEYQIRYLK
jgi:hypothetical protein